MTEKLWIGTFVAKVFQRISPQQVTPAERQKKRKKKPRQSQPASSVLSADFTCTAHPNLHGAKSRWLAEAINGTDVVQGLDFWRQTAVDAQKLPVH